MRHIEGTGSYLRTAAGKTITAVAFFAAVFLVAGFLLSSPVRVYAAEDTALTVTKDGTFVKEFKLEDLQEIADTESEAAGGESLSYSFSSWCSDGIFSTTGNVHGPTVGAVLEAAGIRDAVTGKRVVSFTGNEGSIALTGDQLFDEIRGIYPNGELAEPAAGVIPEKAKEDFEETAAVISLDAGHSYSLFVGQAAPNEENEVLFISGIASGGVIDVQTKKDAVQCSQVDSDPVKDSTWHGGKEISLYVRESDGYDSTGDRIYYSMESSVAPGYGSAVYNYGPGGKETCKPVLPGDKRSVYLKVIVKSYGKQDSKPQGLTFHVGDALTIKVDGEVIKSYETGDLNDLAEENDKIIRGPLVFSGFNSYPTHSSKRVASSFDVEQIIKASTGEDAVSYGNNSVIRFTGADGYSAVFTIGQLFGCERWYFPNANTYTSSDGYKGEPSQAAEYEGKQAVPVVIEATGENTLRFGQTAPNDQNFPECVNYMLTHGVIEITTEEAERCDPVKTATPADGSVIESGTMIELPELSEENKRDKVYYIVDPAGGEIPGSGSALYHYAPFRWEKKLFNQPVIEGVGEHKLAVRVCSYGKQDSEVTYFTYIIKENTDPDPSDPPEPSDPSGEEIPEDTVKAPEKPDGVKASAVSYKSVRLTWNKQADITEYRIYRSAGKGGFSLLKKATASKTSFTDTGLKTGTKYSYRISAVRKGSDGRVFESSLSKTVSAKPVLKRPALRVKAGRSKVSVKWNKISGANGYIIYRSTKKNSGFKAVKTIKKGKTVSYTDKKVKKDRNYYYKIRAYRSVNGKKVCSSYSAVKRAKVK